MVPLAPCGTPAAYRRHLRAREAPCAACRKANRDAKRDQSDQRRRTPKPASTSTSPDSAHPPVDTAGPSSAAADLRMVRSVLVTAIRKVTTDDPTRLAPLIRELRETWKALDVQPDTADTEDEFTVARRRRASLRAPDA